MSAKPMDHHFTIKLAGGIIFAVIILIIAVMMKDSDLHKNPTEGTEQINLSDKDFRIQEYIYDNESSNKTYLLVVKNNSAYTVNFDCNTSAYEEDGTYIGINYNRINAIEPGNSGCMEFDFDNEYAQRFKYELYYEVSNMDSGMDKVKTSDSQTGTTVSTACTNDGNSAVDYLRADVLFFANNELVDYDFSYINNGTSSQLKPDDSFSHDFDCNVDFDSYQVYYSCQNIK